MLFRIAGIIAFLLVDLPQQRFNAITVLQRRIENEKQSGNIAQAQPFPQFPTEKGGGTLQAFFTVYPDRFVTHGGEIDPRQTQIRGNFYIRDGDKTDSRILQSPKQEGGYFFMDLFSDPVSTLIFQAFLYQ
jgi:hypothetical protein